MSENAYTREDLLKLGIYDLREIGREVGVPSPTTLKKQDLVNYIVGIIYGTEQKKQDGNLRGRPARSKQKSYQKFVDLIDKLDSPKINSSFIDKTNDFFDNSFSFTDTLSVKVASPSQEYSNDALEQNELVLSKGVVCIANSGFVVRKLRYVESVSDTKIPEKLAREYNLQEDDMIDYLPDEYNHVAQIIKVNGKFISKTDIALNKLKSTVVSEDITITPVITVKSQNSSVIYASTEVLREELIEKADNAFDEMGYNIVKVCYDRLAPTIGASRTMNKSEFFAECVGDEYETIEMTEAGVERTKFYASLGYKTVLLIDNLAWLFKVTDTYPSSVYGNYVTKLAKLSKNANITVVCFSGHLSNERVRELENMFDKIIKQ